MKMIKKDEESKQEIKTEIYLKKKKIKTENMEEKDTKMSKEKKQKLKEYQKITVRLKNLPLNT